MQGEITSATRGDEAARLQLQYRARHRRGRERPRRITETQKSEVHRQLWPESWRHGNVSGGESRIGSSVTTEVAFTMSPSSRLFQPSQPQVRTRHPELPVADWQALDVLHNPCRK